MQVLLESEYHRELPPNQNTPSPRRPADLRVRLGAGGARRQARVRHFGEDTVHAQEVHLPDEALAENAAVD